MFEHLMMKHLFLLFFLVVITAASAIADEPNESRLEAEPFVHPGLLHSRAELDFVREKVQAGQEPWKSAWERLRSSRPHKPHRRRSRRSRDHDKERAGVSSLKYEPSPSAEVVRGPYNDPNIGSSNFSNDSMAAYSHALQWWMTGKKAHASKAIEILNAWSTTLESISGHDARLLIGMGGLGFCNAAELIRHSEAEWEAEDQARIRGHCTYLSERKVQCPLVFPREILCKKGWPRLRASLFAIENNL